MQLGPPLVFVILHLFSKKLFNECTLFCELSCGENHTVCKEPQCKRNFKCGKYFEAKAFRPEEIDSFIEELNHFRMNYAHHFDNSTSIANMNAVSYCKEIEFVAQCWANYCQGGGRFDECRVTSKYENVSQLDFNLEYKNGESIDNTIHTVLKIMAKDSIYFVNSWIWNRLITCLQLITHDIQPGSMQIEGSKFAQLVWANTVRVGCGRVLFRDKDGMRCLIICNFAPSQLMIPGEKIFRKGKACTKCDEGQTCNSIYNGLCGQLVDWRDSTFEPPFDVTLSGPKYSLHILQHTYVIVVYFFL